MEEQHSESSSTQISSTGDDKVWKRWRAQYLRVEEEVQQLVISDHVFRRSMAFLAECPEARRRSYVYGWMKATYMRDAILGVRRQLDRTKNAESLRRLLEDVARRPSVLSVERFSLEYPEPLRETAPLEFGKLVGPHSAITRRSVLEDLGALDGAWTSPGIQAIAQSRLAHARPDVPAPTTLRWQDIHDCIATIERVCLRYRYLLMQWDNKTLLPCNVEDFDQDIGAFWL